MSGKDDTKIGSIRHLVEHAERPLHPFLSYCEFLLGLVEHQESQVEIREPQQWVYLVDAARRVCDHFEKPGVIYRTREECDLINWLHTCVTDCEAPACLVSKPGGPVVQP